jgi:hypothetical protein
MFATCRCTVCGLRTSRSAISASLRPAATSRRYEFTAQLATLEPLPPELERVLEAVQGDQDEMDAFAHVGGAVTSPAEFLSDENVGRLLAANA